jgi:hypothetical protein
MAQYRLRVDRVRISDNDTFFELLGTLGVKIQRVLPRHSLR